LHVDGRRGDLIITGGENVWPEAVEAILASHPAVAEAMVRGVDDDEWGQVVEAVIVPAAAGDPPTLDSLRAYVKEAHPAFMAPRSIRIVDALPRTSLGKLRRSTTFS
jgi:o-succinylbenzoate---CoA ligase